MKFEITNSREVEGRTVYELTADDGGRSIVKHCAVPHEDTERHGLKLAALEAWRDLQFAKYGAEWRTVSKEKRPAFAELVIG